MSRRQCKYPQVAVQELILLSHNSLTSTTAHNEWIQYYHTSPLILTTKINCHYTLQYHLLTWLYHGFIPTIATHKLYLLHLHHSSWGYPSLQTQPFRLLSAQPLTVNTCTYSWHVFSLCHFLNLRHLHLYQITMVSLYNMFLNVACICITHQKCYSKFCSHTHVVYKITIEYNIS